MSGHGIFRENYKARGWFAPISSFMNKAGKFMNNVRGSGDVQVTPNADGGLDILFEGRGGSGSGASTHPFLVRDISSDSEKAISVKAGGINNRVVESDSMPVEAAGIVYAELTLSEDSGDIQEIELKIASEIPESTLTAAHIALARLTETEDGTLAIDQLVTHSLWFYRCGSSPEAFHHFFGAI